MTPYDGAMAGVILAGMIWGAFRGITWQIASIASLVLGYTLAHSLSVQVAPYFPGEPIVARSLAMIAVYLGTTAGVFFVAWMIRATLKKMKFEAFDRHLGMLLGGLEGALLGLMVTLFVVSLAPRTRGPIFASPSGKVVGWLMASVGPILPSEARSVLGPFLGTAEASQDSPTIVDMEPTTPSQAASLNASTVEKTGSRVLYSAPLDGAAERASGSLGDLIKEEEARLSKAISAGAAQGVKQAVGGMTGGAVERR